MRPDPVNRLRASALAASCALSCLACDALVGLDPTVLVTDLPLKDAATPAVGFEASPEAMTGMNAAPEGAPDAACTPCPTGCVDTNSDGDNCGACGHSCLGATCSGGACVAVILTTGAPADLAVDQTNVYWTDGTNGNVKRCPIAGCSDGGETLFVGSGANLGGAGLVAGIALQGSRVVFAENTAGMGEVYACPTDGCGTAPAPFARETGGQVGAVAADATNVYWTSTLDQSVHECPIDGCAGPYPTALAIGSVNALDPWGLVVRDGRFYFAYAQYGFGFSEGVGGCSIAGCTCTMGACVLPSPVASAPAVTALAAGMSGIFWTSESTNEIIANPIGTNSPAAASLLGRATVPGKIAVDPDENVYFTTQQPQAIYRCAAGGCGDKPTVAASGLGSLGDIVVDAKRIYAVTGTQTNQVMPAAASSAQPAAPTGSAIVWVAR